MFNVQLTIYFVELTWCSNANCYRFHR